MFAAVRDVYRRTRKPNDILWNRLVARPLAAVVVAPLARTSITPNQVTFATLIVFLGGAALMAFVPTWGALIGGAAIIEFSYVLDCADGQLARLKGTSSPVGAHLDFLMDELKAFALVAAAAPNTRPPLALPSARASATTVRASRATPPRHADRRWPSSKPSGDSSSTIRATFYSWPSPTGSTCSCTSTSR